MNANLNFLKKKFPLIVRTLGMLIRLIVIAYEFLFLKKIIEINLLGKHEIINIDQYQNIFCGYYDVSPFKPDNSDFILLHATNMSANKVPDTNHKVDLLLYQISKKNFRLIDRTSTWNWQQGTRLQWLDKNKIIYNVLVNGQVKCKIIDIKNNKEEILPIPLSIAKTSVEIISIDYPALTKGSEYGYYGIDVFKDDSFIQMYNLNNRKKENLFNWKELDYLAYPNANKKHINHILFSNNKDRIVFIYRYWIEKIRYDSLIEYNFKTKSFNVIIKNQVVSHYCWIDNDTLFAWIVINNTPGYYIINVSNNDISLSLELADGHPSSIGNNKFITDRYIGKKFGPVIIQAEILDIVKKEKYPLIKLSHPLLLNQKHRCDMHISVSDDKKKFQLDARFVKNRRSVIIADMKNFID